MARGLLLPGATGEFYDSALEQLNTDLQRGKPEVGWRGDARLELRIGVAKRRNGEEIGRRLEVWRDCSDSPQCKRTETWGTWTIIGHWKMFERDRVLRDMAEMDVRSRGHTPMVDQLDADDAAQEKLTEDRYREAAGPMYEHMLALVRDRETKHFFGQMGGSGKMTRQRRRAEARGAKT